jgi:hypothetical protein
LENFHDNPGEDFFTNEKIFQWRIKKKLKIADGQKRGSGSKHCLSVVITESKLLKRRASLFVPGGFAVLLPSKVQNENLTGPDPTSRLFEMLLRHFSLAWLEWRASTLFFFFCA